VSVIRGSDGSFYGTTRYGGANSSGVVFKISESGGTWTISVLHHFAGGAAGQNPLAGLVEGTDGYFYGVCSSGPTFVGAVYRIHPSIPGSFQFIHGFNGTTEGRDPWGELVRDAAGNLYGTLRNGGLNNFGSVFKMTPTGTTTVLHHFTNASGRHPGGPLYLDPADGSLWGLTEADNVAGGGTVFRITGVVAQPPSVTTTAPTSITTATAQAQATVNPNGQETTGHFEWGVAPNFGNTTPPQALGSSTSGIALTGVLSPLAPHTQYQVRAVATNATGTTQGNTITFTSANTLPAGGADDFSLTGYTPQVLDVLANDVDADGDALTITGVTTPAHGSVQLANDGLSVTYDPADGYAGGDSFDYTISDGFGGTATATVTITIASPDPVLTPLFVKGGAVPGAGVPGSGVPAGAIWKTFGVPAINAGGHVAFIATYAAGSASETAIFAGPPSSPVLVAKKGEAAPDLSGPAFASFKDPLLGDDGSVTFLATLSGVADASQRTALFSDALGAGLQLLAQSGTAAPGTGGTVFKAFTSVAVSEGAAPPAVFFTATLMVGTGSPATTAANDSGIWVVKADPVPKYIVREGDPAPFAGAGATVKSFKALVSRAGAPGQGNGAVSLGSVAYLWIQALASDGTVANGYADDTGALTWLYAKGQAAPGYGGAVWTSLGLPTQNLASAACFLGTMKAGTDSATSANNVAIFAEDDTSFALAPLVAKGDAAAGIAGAAFASFAAVVSAANHSVAFTGRAAGGGVHGAIDQGLWWLTATDELRLIAREGSQPEDVPAGAQWAAFPSLALPEGSIGPLFTGKLRIPRTGEPNPAGITAANDLGLWAVDSTGANRLLIRKGMPLGGRTVKTFLALSSVAGSPSQTRAFNSSGEVVLRITFDDASQGIVLVEVP
jgi:uncharacterized repeat protein (TIGR03803 family)